MTIYFVIYIYYLLIYNINKAQINGQRNDRGSIFFRIIIKAKISNNLKVHNIELEFIGQIPNKKN